MIFQLMGSLADEQPWGVAAVLYARRESETSFEARRLCDAAYLEFIGARDADLAERIDDALAADRGETIRSMRCDSHFEDDATCWLHGEHFCLSRLAPDQLQRRNAGELWDGPGVGLKLAPFNALNVSAVWPSGAVMTMMARAAFRRPCRTPGPFACLVATPNDDALRTCAIFGCGRPPQARAGRGLSLTHCRYHVQKRNRHGSFWKGTYSATDLKDYRRAAERYLKAHADDFWIAAALASPPRDPGRRWP